MEELQKSLATNRRVRSILARPWTKIQPAERCPSSSRWPGQYWKLGAPRRLVANARSPHSRDEPPAHAAHVVGVAGKVARAGAPRPWRAVPDRRHRTARTKVDPTIRAGTACRQIKEGRRIHRMTHERVRSGVDHALAAPPARTTGAAKLFSRNTRMVARKPRTINTPPTAFATAAFARRCQRRASSAMTASQTNQIRMKTAGNIRSQPAALPVQSLIVSREARRAGSRRISHRLKPMLPTTKIATNAQPCGQAQSPAAV